MLSAKGFAAGEDVTPYFGSAAAAITASNIVASIAAPKRAVSNVGPQTSATEKLRKGNLINATDSELTASVAPHFPLWIKVPRSVSKLAASSRLLPVRRFLSDIAAKTRNQECLIA
jgi:hypothetical protein